MLLATGASLARDRYKSSRNRHKSSLHRYKSLLHKTNGPPHTHLPVLFTTCTNADHQRLPCFLRETKTHRRWAEVACACLVGGGSKRSSPCAPSPPPEQTNRSPNLHNRTLHHPHQPLPQRKGHVRVFPSSFLVPAQPCAVHSQLGRGAGFCLTKKGDGGLKLHL